MNTGNPKNVKESFGDISPLSQRAALSIVDFLEPFKDPILKKLPGEEKSPVRFRDTETEPYKVGIIGAGAAGLFAAMIFDYLTENTDLKIEYEILEAHGEERLGGRLYSHYFRHMGPNYPTGKHDYYDVGAMRFPESRIMTRLFDLFKVLDMKKTPDGQVPVKGELVPYIFKHPKQPTLYNGVKVVLGDKPLTASAFGISGIPDESASDLVSDALKPFLDSYKHDSAEVFWKKILKDAEPYSVRQYFTEFYDFKTTEFLETVEYGDGWYNQGLTDRIIEAIIFDPGPKWWCIEGGSQELAQRMYKKLKRQNSVYFGKRVVGMEYINDKEQINVRVSGESVPRQYDAVFNSAPLGAMQRMDLKGLNLSWQVKSAIRSLGYGASCKVGVRFKDLWWKKHFGIDTGGAARTDLPIRQCIYPSYNASDDKDKPGVLLVSYCWGQEADRIGALINRQSPQGEDELKEVLIHDLARLHAESDTEYERVHKIIADSYLDHFAHDWRADPHTTGAFAYFGPGQFKYMYPGITANDGKHIIVGEAASARHGWVVGALDSVVRGVFQFLYRHADENPGVKAAYQLYQENIDMGPYGPLPDEYSSLPFVNERLRLDDGGLPASSLAQFQVEVERLRQKKGTD
ncbi:hypothetical protein TWF281_010897 [Arthrobotrys megalospora]